MDRFSYFVGLLSIITGLALADVAISLQRLLKRRANVRWDWLTLAIAGYFAFVLVRYWYQVWGIRRVEGGTELFFFLSIIAENFLLFLIAASSLPDEDDFTEGAIDLRQFQQKNCNYIWGLFLLFSLSWTAHGYYFNRDDLIFATAVFAIPVILAAALAFSRRRQIQILLFGALLIHEVWWMIHSRF